MKHSIDDQGDVRKYFAAIPNIVFKLGLSPHELAVYTYLKMVAGDGGKCSKSTTTIAKDLSMGAGSVSRAKERLARRLDGIGGKALISVEIEMRNGGNPNHLVTITDIWPENMAELARLREQKAARSTVEGAQGVRVPPWNARVPEGKATRSTVEPNKNSSNKNPEQESERDFIQDLRNDPLYQHVDLDSEIVKMQRWLALPTNRGRRLTQRFVVNWLNRIDRPVTLPHEQPASPVNGDRAAREAELKQRMGWDKFERST